MHPPEPPQIDPLPNPFTAADVLSLLNEKHWLTGPPSADHLRWSADAASLLGHFAADRAALAQILRLIFEFDATEIMHLPESPPSSPATPPATSSATSLFISSNPANSIPTASNSSSTNSKA